MSQVTKELTLLMEKLPRSVQEQIYHYAQAEADKLGIGDKVKTTMPTLSFLEVAQQRGLVGIYQDGPADLSSNSEHMEGFGK